MKINNNNMDNLPEFPYGWLIASISLILVTLLLFAITTYQSIEIARYNLIENRIIELNNSVLRLDEESGMAVRMAAMTKEKKWLIEYDEINKRLNNEIVE